MQGFFTPFIFVHCTVPLPLFSLPFLEIKHSLRPPRLHTFKPLQILNQT